MARSTLGIVRQIALRLVAVLLIGAGTLALVVCAWMAFTQHARTERETHSAQQLAAGKGRWIAVGDADLDDQEWGRPGDPTVLLTHGTGAWSGTWFALPAALAKGGWRVVAVDLPPFGLTQTRRADATVDYTRAAQARRVLGLIEQLGVSVTLVGHSFGAGPALEAAMLGGVQLRHLVLVDPALGLGPHGEALSCDAAAEGGLLRNRPMRSSLVSATATWPGLTALMLRQFVHRKEAVIPHIEDPAAFATALLDAMRRTR